MEAIAAIAISAIILRKWWKSQSTKPDPRKSRRNTVKTEKLKQEATQARNAEIERRKQQDTELITVVLPTIDSDR